MKIYVTRNIPESGLALLRKEGYEMVMNPDDRVLTKEELVAALSGKGFDAVLCLLTDAIDDAVFEAAGPQCKIFANYAVGFNNIDLAAAAARGIIVTNTPGVLNAAVAEHTIALLLSIVRRIPEGDRFIRANLYKGWEPMMLLGGDVAGKTLGIIGTGAIGSRVAHIAARGFDMNIIYHDIKPSESLEKEYGARFYENIDDIFREADFVSLHVPLLPSTQHLVNADRLALMKKSAYLINTSRGPVIDEAALAQALQEKKIAGAALDVFENEPALAPGLSKLDNVVLTPHIASATEKTRSDMADLAARNIIEVLSGRSPLTAVPAPRAH